MANNYAQVHHLTTSGETTTGHGSGNTTFGDRNEYNSSQAYPREGNVDAGANTSTNTYARDTTSSTPRQNTTGAVPQDDSISPVPRDSVSGQALNLDHEYEPRTSISQSKHDPLAGTEGPFKVPTTDDVSKSGIPPFSSVGQQNAPGRAGSIGEKALSALGYGGNHVERPKEDQGLGEKIVNFLGA